MPDFVKNYVMLGMAILIAVLGLAAFEYKRLYKATDFALKTQNAAIESQKKTAKDTMDRLTKERDDAQTALNTRAAAQEKEDGSATKAIATDTARAATAPVRVRYVSVPARCGGGSPADNPAPDAQAGAGDAGAASGVLAPAAAELFKRDQDAIETLQAAFNSCKSTWTK